MAKLKKTHENTLSGINGKSDALVITGVNIVDVLNRTVHENSTIICRGGKISEIGPSSSLAIPENATVIELLTVFYIIKLRCLSNMEWMNMKQFELPQ